MYICLFVCLLFSSSQFFVCPFTHIHFSFVLFAFPAFANLFLNKFTIKRTYNEETINTMQQTHISTTHTHTHTPFTPNIIWKFLVENNSRKNSKRIGCLVFTHSIKYILYRINWEILMPHFLTYKHSRFSVLSLSVFIPYTFT